MSNKYPNSFYLNCVGNIPCDRSSNCIHENSKIKKEIIENKKIHLLREKIYPRGNINLSSKCNNIKKSICEGYDNPSKIIGNNIDFELTNSHSWSNTRSYGNIVIATNDTCNNIHGKVKPFTLTKHKL